MRHRFVLWCGLVALSFSFLPGCGQRDWEVTVENKSDVPSSFFVTMQDGSSKAHVEDVAKGKLITLISGSGENIVNTVKVVRRKDEELLTPNAALSAGNRFAICVEANGKVSTSIVKK